MTQEEATALGWAITEVRRPGEVCLECERPKSETVEYLGEKFVDGRNLHKNSNSLDRLLASITETEARLGRERHQ